MLNSPLTDDLFEVLYQHERSLLRKHGVHLRIDRITGSGNNALCSIWQEKRAFFRSTFSSHTLIAMGHEALNRVHQLGITPLISALSEPPHSTPPQLDKKDPFGFSSALREASLGDVPSPAPQVLSSAVSNSRLDALKKRVASS